MIVYLDTSALIPLVVHEPGTAVAAEVWRSADDVISSRLIIVESTAALARAQRMGRIDEAQFATVHAAAMRLIRDVHLVDVTAEIIDEAARLAVSASLRGHDAIHLATADRFLGDELVLATGDHDLLDAGRSRGMHVADTSGA